MSFSFLKRVALFAFFIFLIIVLDQLTKNWIMSHFYLHETKSVISGFFNITYVKNPGAAFGIFGTSNHVIRLLLIFIVPVIACFALIIFLKQVWRKNLILELAYCMIFAGAIGNLIDRFMLNYVVDFLDFYLKIDGQAYHFAAFNIADASISIAAGLLILDLIVASIKKAKNKDIVVKSE